LVPLTVQNPKAKMAIESAKVNNDKSQSNGSLMRCTPMAVFTSDINNKADARNAILMDVKMTHPNKLV
jgi:ADP-ribosylglycohydrolase